MSSGRFNLMARGWLGKRFGFRGQIRMAARLCTVKDGGGGPSKVGVRAWRKSEGGGTRARITSREPHTHTHLCVNKAQALLRHDGICSVGAVTNKLVAHHGVPDRLLFKLGVNLARLLNHFEKMP